MKFNSKIKGLCFKWLFFPGLVALSMNVSGQNRSAIMADAKLGQIELTDINDYPLDANNLQYDQTIKLKIPVASESHGKSLPAGSCKIKIGFGSKLVLDPQFDLSSAGMGNFFKWTSSTSGGQLQVTAELINSLPANVSSVDVALRVKGKGEGKSTITANFLITNHNTSSILSDENGANNATFLSYRIKKFDLQTIPDGQLKLGIFPNPVHDVKSVMIKLVQGRLIGKYSIGLYDVQGKLLRAKELQLNSVSNFSYELGNIAAGQYHIKVLNTNGTQSSVLKFEKL